MMTKWELGDALSGYHNQWIEEIRDSVQPLPHMRENHTFMMNVTKMAPLLDRVRSVTGTHLRLHQIRGIVLPTFRQVAVHRHLSQRVYLYMLHNHESALRFGAAGERVETREGRLVEILEQQYHSVEYNKWDARYTIALMFIV